MKSEIAGTLVEWDENKNQQNIKKHGISFQTTALVFADGGGTERPQCGIKRSGSPMSHRAMQAEAKQRYNDELRAGGLNTLTSCTARMKKDTWFWDAFKESCMLFIP